MREDTTSFKMVNFWIVNQGKTFEDEFVGGFLWAPITNKKGSKITYYTNVTKVGRGDIIFSLVKGTIPAICVCEEDYVECKKPPTGHNNDWICDGWKIIVRFTEIDPAIVVKDHIDRIRPLLPTKYSPINKDGNAQQGGYLSAISEELAHVLCELSGQQIDGVSDEDAVELGIRGRTDITSTEKIRLTKSRQGQGQYKQNVYENETMCRVTGVCDRRFLNASHIKPWAKSSDTEKLDGCNGLLLTLNVDRAFDGGWISFTDNGDILCSTKVEISLLKSLGIDPAKNVGKFNKGQCGYMKYHREHVFRP
jgi:putative restriction endonuclease